MENNRFFEIEKIISENIKNEKYGSVFTNSDIYNVENSNLKNIKKILTDVDIKNSIAWAIWNLTKDRQINKLSKGVHILSKKTIFDVEIELLLDKLLGTDNWHTCKETLAIQHELNYQTMNWARIFTLKNLDKKNQYKDIKEILEKLKVSYEVIFTKKENLKPFSYSTLLTYIEDEKQEIIFKEILENEKIDFKQIIDSVNNTKKTWKN